MFEGKQKKKPGIHFEIIPMIDVMMILVLFLAVMAFLPSVQSAIQTDLPTSGSKDQVSMEDLLVNINASGVIFVEDSSTTLEGLVPMLLQRLGSETDTRIVIAADKNLSYEYVVEILARLREGNIKNIALATEKEN